MMIVVHNILLERCTDAQSEGGVLAGTGSAGTGHPRIGRKKNRSPGRLRSLFLNRNTGSVVGYLPVTPHQERALPDTFNATFSVTMQTFDTLIMSLRAPFKKCCRDSTQPLQNDASGSRKNSSILPISLLLVAGEPNPLEYGPTIW
jgi:hypothetical protein